MGNEMVENVAEEDKQGINTHIIKHFCKICNKGFGCAGALGGHMRAHVTMGDVSDEHNHNNPPFPPNGDHEKPEPANNKHSYFLRAKTPRFMGYHVSEFEDGEYLRKSSSFPFVKYALDKERVSPLLSSTSRFKSQNLDHHENNSALSEEEDLANCLVMLSNNKSCCNNNEENKAKEAAFEKGMFQCKACKKVFNSHQALGGHRASHKKVKGCFAAKIDIIGPLNDEFDDEPTHEDHHHHEHDVSMTPSSAPEPNPTNTTSNTRKPRTKMHECSVCRRVFSSGQALGGHKRCHWLTTSADNAFIPNFHDFQCDQHHHQSQQIYKKPMLTNPHHHERDLDDNHHEYNHDLDLNLNLPANVGNFRDTRFYLQKLTNHSQQRAIETDDNSGKKGSCEMKLRKLSDLRDVNLDGGWLQVGIASNTDIY